METQILSALLFDREAFESTREFVETTDFSDHGRILYTYIASYYDRDTTATEADPVIISRRIAKDFPTSDSALQAVLESLEPVSTPNVIDDYVDMRLESLGDDIAQAVVDRETDSVVLQKMDSYRILAEKRQEALSGEAGLSVTVGCDLSAVPDQANPGALIPAYPEELNEILGGGYPRGTHVVPYARPESGKSLFTIATTAHMARAGHRVLLFSNEDKIPVMQMRLTSNFTSTPISDLWAMSRKQRQYYQDKANECGMSDVILVDQFPGTIGLLNNLVKQYEPDALMIDQLRNMVRAVGDNKTDAFETTFQDARNLAKREDIVVFSLTQAGESAKQKFDLGMSDIDGSKTGVQSTAEVLLGIGWDEEEGSLLRRFNFTKNKVSGRHDRPWVNFHPQTSTITMEDM